MSNSEVKRARQSNLSQLRRTMVSRGANEAHTFECQKYHLLFMAHTRADRTGSTF